MAEIERYDVIVIGTGPGGEGAAMQACKEGKRVAVMERYSKIGGGCTHWGTIPSKALRYAIYRMLEYNQSPIFREGGLAARFPFPKLRATAASVIAKQVDMRRNFYDRNDVNVIFGQAKLVDPHTVEVCEDYGAVRRFHAPHIVIASGSRPARPEGVDFTHPCIFDSDTILSLDHTPQSITVYGAGVIGCEYASMFRNMGVKVNLVHSREKLLEFLDDEIIDALSYHLRDQGVLIRHREEFEKVEGLADGVNLYLKSGKVLKTDILLWAAGRQGNSDNMGLEEIGIVPDRRGNITINEDFQTIHPHIYAVGDVVGRPSLASAAYVQGRFAAMHLIHGQSDRVLVSDIPTGIYTSPEISSLGKTERELTEMKVPYEVGHSMFKSLARAQITGRTVGMLKILFHRDTLELLGIHCFGAQASEIIHIGQAIMTQPSPNNTINYFLKTTFNYPTMAEAYRVAALNGYNRVR
jgi:NAD(P) transhydrogenase